MLQHWVRVPCGIMVRGAAQHVELRDNDIHDIWYHTASGNAFGIAIYGNTPGAGGLYVDGGTRRNPCLPSRDRGASSLLRRVQAGKPARLRA